MTTLAALGTAASVAFVITGQQATAAPLTALQAVQVRLGTDGSITGITSQLVSKAGNSEVNGSSQGLDPSQWGSKLPLRVQISYEHGDQRGTNLQDLVGKSGEFVINVTVQNTSVTARQVQSSYVLTGTPMTVVATADLGNSSGVHVVTPANASSSTAPATSGVVSQNSNGHSQVQYSALLVPPVLPASATFTLVEDTNKFAVPTINIAAQPQVTADPSSSQLLQSAFGSNAAGMAAQNATIHQITGINDQLDVVLSTLSQMRSTLNQGSTTLTQTAIVNLRQNSLDLESRLVTLAGSLNGTSQCVGDTLQNAAGDPASSKSLSTCSDSEKKTAQSIGNIQSQINASMAKLHSLILGPAVGGSGNATSLANAQQPLNFFLNNVGTSLLSTLTLSDVPNQDACSPNSRIVARATSPAPALSLLGQVQALNGWFGALSDASTLCAQTLGTEIHNVVNDLTTQLGQAQTDFSTAVGVPGVAGASGTGLLGQLSAQLADANPASNVQNLYTDLDGLVGAIAGLKTNNQNNYNTISSDIATVQQDFTAVTSALGSTSDLTSPIGKIWNDANQQWTALNNALTSGGANSLTGQLTSGLSTICSSTPTVAPDPSANQSDLYNYYEAVQQACAGSTAVPSASSLPDVASSVVQNMSDARDAFDRIRTQAQTLSDDINTAGGVLQTLGDDLQTAADDVPNPAPHGGQGIGGLLGHLNSSLVALLGNLLDTSGPTPTITVPSNAPSCSPAPTATEAPGSISRVFEDFEILYCSQSNYASAYGSALSSFAPNASAIASKLGDASASADSLSSTLAGSDGTGGQIGTFMTTFHQALASAAAGASSGLGASALALDQAIGTTSGNFNTHLDRATLATVNAISDQFNAAVCGQKTCPTKPTGKAEGGLFGASDILKSQTAGLLNVLQGTDGHGGLVRTLSTNIGSAQNAFGVVNKQKSGAAQFQAVQLLEVANAQSIRDALTKALTDPAASVGAFGIDVPSGSKVLPVYTFQLGGN